MTQASTWSDHVHAVLSRAGLNRGGARERVIELLAKQDCALSAVEIEEQLKASGRSTARASVYGVLDLLVDHGLSSGSRSGMDRRGSSRCTPAAPTTITTWCASGAGVWWRSTTGARTRDQRAVGPPGVRVEHHDALLRGACGRCD